MNWQLKEWREAAGLTLAEVSARCGIDQRALSRLEHGVTRNPTLDMLWRYAAALGKRTVLSAEDIQESRANSSPLKRPAPKKAPGRQKEA